MILRDWMEMAWFSKEYTRPELRGTNFHGVPFTCCDPTYPGPCLHDTGDQQLPGFRKDSGKSFYSDGCSEVATVTLQWMLKNLAVWLLLPVWLELVILVLIKYLHSSIRSAIDSGDETGNGYGYLMERCPLHCFEFCETDIHALQRRKVNGKK
ncbi:hypothetical protein AVEN_103210-1 [Araneus ventricosus]|uniref:Uncharacterized protein n=1 Tax=Araneus ventricosus TaxID=182803 RepID=A0A4Y2F9G5_ARAVE|nr:hypothetical protein AVEN_103210-1 [Araneus ventricosus]